MECGSLHPSSSLSGFRASLEMSWPWLEAEQSPQPSMLPGTSGNLPPSAFFSLAGTTPTCASRARLDGTDKQEGWMWIRVVYSLSNSLKNKPQTFLVTNVKSFPDEVCSQEKRASSTSHPREDTLLGSARFQSPSVPSHSARSSLSLSPCPHSHKLQHPETQYLQTTDSHITTLPVSNAWTWSFKGQK